VAIYPPVPPPILQVIAATHRRGAEIYAVDLRDELRRRGRSMELVALRPGQGPSTLDVATLSDTRFGGLRRLRGLARASRGVLAHGSDTLPATVIATLGTDVPFVYRSIGDPAFWSARRSRRLPVGAQLRRAAAVAVTNQGAADTLLRAYGLTPERVRVIPNGRPLDRFPSPTIDERRRARDRLLGGLAGPVVGFLGALSHEKGPDRAIQAVAQLPDTHLLVAGDGALRPMLEAYAEAIAPGRIHFIGTVADPRELLLAVDAVVVPSRSEGFPGVAIEAGLTAVPVVATAVGAIPEVVIDGTTGFVVGSGRPGDLADALRAAAARHDDLGRAARAECVGRYDLRSIADQWDALLDEAFG
jgi:glycosyltransferase involved in cell wall biosynthesis